MKTILVVFKTIFYRIDSNLHASGTVCFNRVSMDPQAKGSVERVYLSKVLNPFKPLSHEFRGPPVAPNDTSHGTGPWNFFDLMSMEQKRLS